MDELALAAQATTLALTVGAFISFAQERFLGRAFSGRQAVVLNIALALGIGVVAAARVGVTIAAPATDVFSFALEVLKVAAAIAVASKVAFEVLTRPVTMRRV